MEIASNWQARLHEPYPRHPKLQPFGPPPGAFAAICHADCPEDAEYVRAKVEEKYHPNKIIMSEVGPIVGAHVGPGTMVLIFDGDKR